MDICFFSSRRRHTRCALVTGVQTCALPILKQALATEIELNKLKSNFVTLASHEFRTPLTAVLSSASLIERYALGENQEKVAKHVNRIKGAVDQIGRASCRERVCQYV